MRRTASVLVIAGLLLVAPHAGAARKARATTAAEQPVVAVIDTGVRATHQEFNYGGSSSTTDQFVGWWDFTTETKQSVVLPNPGQTWDTSVADPYDKNGHGTLTASMVAGRGADPRKTPAAYAGGKVAIAKVGNGDGTIEGNIGKAVTWATDTSHADVISISIGTIVPVPTFLEQADYDAIAAARSKGVLVVVANGNGFANAGIPGDPGWASAYASSTNVLAVGAAGLDGYLVSTDPEVAAIFTVTGPSHTSNNGYITESGTSFATPFVAGFAASTIQAARNAGRTLTADRLETLLKYVATDTVTPPSFEGYGVLSMSELNAAKSHAAAGTLPTRPSPDLSGMYVEQVAGTLRSTWSG